MQLLVLVLFGFIAVAATCARHRKETSVAVAFMIDDGHAQRNRCLFFHGIAVTVVVVVAVVVVAVVVVAFLPYRQPYINQVATPSMLFAGLVVYDLHFGRSVNQGLAS